MKEKYEDAINAFKNAQQNVCNNGKKCSIAKPNPPKFWQIVHVCHCHQHHGFYYGENLPRKCAGNGMSECPICKCKCAMPVELGHIQDVLVQIDQSGAVCLCGK
jgi:hypothetical protein